MIVYRSFHWIIFDAAISLGRLAIVFLIGLLPPLTQMVHSIFVPRHAMVSLYGPADCIIAHLVIVAPNSHLSDLGRTAKGWNWNWNQSSHYL